MAVALSNPSVLVNNIPTPIIPNSLVTNLGKGETNVRSASVGGGGSIPVHTENAEDRVGMVKFKMFVTADNIPLINQWKANTGANLVTGAQLNAGMTFALPECSMTNDPDLTISVDSEVEIEFKGGQVI